MKKNLTIVILAITTILSLLFGYVQKLKADNHAREALKNFELAQQMQIQAEQQMKLAEQQRRIAEANMAEAVRQKQLLEEQLKKN